MSPTGHLAVGFAARKYAPEVPLIGFLVSSYVIDLLYFLFLAIGIDTLDFDPWSHSLVTAIVWSVLVGVLTALLIKKKKIRSGIVLGLVTFSHWILDVIVWDNMPIAFNPAQKIGLGLFTRIGFSFTNLQLNSGLFIAASVELAMLIVGLIIYFSYTRKTKKQKPIEESKPS